MKHILTFSFLLFLASNCFSQNYMDVITKKSCDCLDKIADTLEADRFNMELGLCMIDASMPYKKQIKKDYDIDLDKIDTQGEKLGRTIGLKMASKCPDKLIKMAEKSNPKANPGSNEKISTGVVTNIEKDFFVIFSLKDESGKITKYYWLTFIDSEFDLTNSYETLVNKTLNINYMNQEFFDPNLKEYRQFLIIKKLTVVN